MKPVSPAVGDLALSGHHDCRLAIRVEGIRQAFPGGQPDGLVAKERGEIGPGVRLEAADNLDVGL
jgi:hypothetical protein